MKREQVIELGVTEELRERVMNRVVRAQVRGLSIEACKEQGIYDRISYLLCGMHTLNMVAYRLWGGVEYLLDIMEANAKEIRHANKSFQKAFDGYIKFWTGYYAHDDAGREMNDEQETLYHQFMRWSQLPESWKLGDPTQTSDPTDAVIEIVEPDDERVLRFFRSVLSCETIGEPSEEWVVTKFNRVTKTQVSVEEKMDKASAVMVAKRLSQEDPENIYTASVLQTLTEKRVEAVPFKAFKKGANIGDMKKVLKSK